MEDSVKLCLLMVGVVLPLCLSGYYLWVYSCRKEVD